MPITSITGPFCKELSGTYIAHETDTADINVPIMMEDGENVILPEDAPTGGSTTECEIEEVCCNEPAYFSFINQSVTEIGYSAALRDRLGLTPAVSLFYFDNDADEGGLISGLGVYTKIALQGTPVDKIIVNHGGPATGVIKLQ